MILITVGTQLPFDRLVRAVDTWCAATGRNDVVGQIGDPGISGYRPARFAWRPFIPPRELSELTARAELVIAHAGMGSIISALQHAKPIVIMPRLAALGEHRNGHQQATATRFAERPGIFLARDEREFPRALSRAVAHTSQPFNALPAYADQRLIHSIRRYIITGTPTEGRAVEEMDELGEGLA